MLTAHPSYSVPVETDVPTEAHYRVLVIDDDKHFRGVIAEVLKRLGYEVDVAPNGMAALELLEEKLPHVILSDVWMDEIDGYHLLSVLRRNRKADEIPFIFMTGRDGPQGMRRGMELGADDYLFKPFTRDQLQSAIQARLQRRRFAEKEAKSKLEDLRCSIRTSLPHEFITPLSGLLGLAEIVREDAAIMEPHEVHHSADQMKDLTLRLSRLVNNFRVHAELEMALRDPSKIESLKNCRTGDPTPHFSRHARRMAQQWGREMDLTLSLECVPAGKCLGLSEQYLSKVIEELIDNSFKFSQPGTPVQLTLHQLAGGCLMTLHDEGRGMTATQLRRIGAYIQFDRKFWEQPGAGLGLVIVRRLLQIHEGYLDLESELNAGTTVRAYFPFSRI